MENSIHLESLVVEINFASTKKQEKSIIGTMKRKMMHLHCF